MKEENKEIWFPAKKYVIGWGFQLLGRDGLFHCHIY
jgi:hypothetical protein